MLTLRRIFREGRRMFSNEPAFEELVLSDFYIIPAFPDPALDPQSCNPCRRFMPAQCLIAKGGLRFSHRKFLMIIQVQLQAFLGGRRISLLIKNACARSPRIFQKLCQVREEFFSARNESMARINCIKDLILPWLMDQI